MAPVPIDTAFEPRLIALAPKAIAASVTDRSADLTTAPLPIAMLRVVRSSVVALPPIAIEAFCGATPIWSADAPVPSAMLPPQLFAFVPIAMVLTSVFEPMAAFLPMAMAPSAMERALVPSASESAPVAIDTVPIATALAATALAVLPMATLPVLPAAASRPSATLLLPNALAAVPKAVAEDPVACENVPTATPPD